MNGKKILFVSSELVPYLPENQVSLMSYEAPRMVNSNGRSVTLESLYPTVATGSMCPAVEQIVPATEAQNDLMNDKKDRVS